MKRFDKGAKACALWRPVACIAKNKSAARTTKQDWSL